MKTVQPIEVLLITTKQAAEILNVSERTIANLRYAGHLDSVTIGTARRYSLDSVKKLAASGKGEIEFAAAAIL